MRVHAHASTAGCKRNVASRGRRRNVARNRRREVPTLHFCEVIGRGRNLHVARICPCRKVVAGRDMDVGPCIGAHVVLERADLHGPASGRDVDVALRAEGQGSCRGLHDDGGRCLPLDVAARG